MMADLITNINQAISDFGTIKQAIINKSIDVPDGTPTSEYGKLIEKIQSGKEKYYIYKNGTEMNDHTITFHHTASSKGSDKKDLNWLFIHNWFMSTTSTDKISFSGYSKIFINGIGDGRLSDNSTRFTYLKLTDTDSVQVNGSDYSPSGNVIASLTLACLSENGTSSFGGTYSIDIPEGVTEGYLHIQNVNLDVYVTEIWLE